MTQAAKSAGFVGSPVIGEYLAVVDTQVAVITHGVHERATGTPARFIRVDRAKGDATVIVDGNVNVLPPGASAGLLAIPGHPVPRSLETPESLDIQVQQVAGRFVLVTVLRSGRLQCRQTVESLSLKQSPDGAAPNLQGSGDVAIGLPLAPAFNDLLVQCATGRPRAVLGDRGPIHKACFAFLPVTSQPLICSADTHAGGLGCFRRPEALLEHAAYKQKSTENGQSGILVIVHSGSSEWLVVSQLQFSG